LNGRARKSYGNGRAIIKTGKSSLFFQNGLIETTELTGATGAIVIKIKLLNIGNINKTPTE